VFKLIEPSPAVPDWLSYNYDQQRTGWNRVRTAALSKPSPPPGQAILFVLLIVDSIDANHQARFPQISHDGKSSATGCGCSSKRSGPIEGKKETTTLISEKADKL